MSDEREPLGKDGEEKDNKLFRTRSRAKEIGDKRTAMDRKDGGPFSSDVHSGPRVTLSSNREPTFYIGGGNGVTL